MSGSRKNRSPEEQARRAKIRELLQESNISSMEDIQNLFKETIYHRARLGESRSQTMNVVIVNGEQVGK